MKGKSPALGKGLEALLGNINNDVTKNGKAISNVDAEIANIPLDQIIPNANQPRQAFDEQSLQELAQSIKENGVIVPITVNKHNGKYYIIAGERRYRASKIAGKKDIPAYIRVVTEQASMQMALIENIQREDLNAIEIALSLKALLDATKITQEELSKKIGKSRPAITNYIRLLNLPAEIQLALRSDKISMGQARALINIEDEKTQLDILRRIEKDGLSVREVEQLVQRLKESGSQKKKEENPLPETHNKFANSLSNKLKTYITIKRSKRGKGSITIAFKNDSDFERIVALLQDK